MSEVLICHLKLIRSFMLLIQSWKIHKRFSEIFWQPSWFCFPNYRKWDIFKHIKDLEAFMVVYYVSCRYTVVLCLISLFQSSSSVLRFINTVIAICYLIFTMFPLCSLMMNDRQFKGLIMFFSALELNVRFSDHSHTSVWMKPQLTHSFFNMYSVWAKIH